MTVIEMLCYEKVYVFCRNIRGMILAYWLRKNRVTVVFLDNDKRKWNSCLCDFYCENPDIADPDIPCVIAAETKKNIDAIKSQLMQRSFKEIVLVDKEWEQEWLSGYAPWMSDEEYLKLYYAMKIGEELNLEAPRNFNEKIQWLKINDRKPDYKLLADKYEVKKIVSEKIGSQYVIPTIGIYNSFDEIDFDKLPNRFVLKCTHDSGSSVVCDNKNCFDPGSVRDKIQSRLEKDYYYYEREYSYKGIRPRIIIEECISDLNEDLEDYKFFCFHGEPRMLQVDWGRRTFHQRNLYTTDWEYIDGSIEYPNDPKHHIEKPEKLDEMLCVCRKLSAGFYHMRVDLYYVKGKIYFGEMTFYHGGGYEKITPPELNVKLGNYIHII